LLDAASAVKATAAFAIFCGLSGAVYLFNDISDRDEAPSHPLKRLRPVASGALSVGAAAATAVVLGTAALAGAVAIGLPFALTAPAYIGLPLLYSGWLQL